MFDVITTRDSRGKDAGSENVFGQKLNSLFHTSDNETYAVIDCEDHYEVWPLESETFKMEIARRYYMETGEFLKSARMKEFLRYLKVRALFESPECEVFIRIAKVNDDIYIDLANKKWEQIRITKDGWDIISCIESPARFIRTPGMRSLPRPLKSGSLNSLHQFLNVANEDGFKLIAAYMLGALNPDGPFPILILQGGQGSAKTTTLKMICDCIDPAKANLRSVPQSERDLLISASRSLVQSFDNVSTLSPRMSDAFCKLATGSGFRTRKLFTNDTEQIFEAKRPIILNGISHFTIQNDFLDRAIIVNLPPISDIRSEKEIQEAWKIEKPYILGALCDAISTALANLDHIKLSTPSRMVDFERWVVAAEPALGWKEGSFVEAYRKNRAEIVNVAIESDPLGEAVIKFMKRRADWSGTATKLWEELKIIVPKSILKIKEWPKSPNALSNRLLRLEIFLKQKGIEIEKNRQSDKRILILRNVIQTEMTADTEKHDENAFCADKRSFPQDHKHQNSDDIENGSSELKELEESTQNTNDLDERSAVTPDESEPREEWEV